MDSVFTIALGAILMNNFIFSQFLGCCPFLGCSTKVDTAVGMGIAVTFVMGLASALCYAVNLLLVALDLGYMSTLAFILVIAVLVQFVEMFLKKTVPSLYTALGIYLPLITTNCAVLGVVLLNVQNNYNFIESVVYGITGGLGFLVWRDLVRCRFRWKRLQLHSKLVLTASGILLFGGWLLLLGFEWNASMADLSIPEKLLASFFQAVTPRTAGFNTVDLSKLSDSGNLLTDFLMLIGGSPGSTAGGIKTTTLAVLVLSALASARGRMRVNTFRMSIERETLRQASSILLIYLGMSLTAILAICAIEPFGLKAVTFEVVSAIATVGLSLGLTPQLSAASRVILILLMYAGRIGGLSFVLLFSERRSEPPLDRPTGKILIG